ncbi:MAG: hypothetical protein MUO42_05660, partial [Anaerolineaceae bacterium]|nr:hypothetical protein [Anaerolineaceae bacterium]
SEVRKVFLDIRNDKAEFRDLRIGKPSSLEYRDIVLSNITAMGEWPFTITDADVTFTDSDYLFLQPSGKSTLRLINSHIVEFIPRNFTGAVEFENSTWSVAGEIIGDVAYHSQSNNFTIKGSLKIADNLRENLQWSNAKVTRYFDVMMTDSNGSPIKGGMIRINNKEYETDEKGWAQFPIIFDETNFKESQRLEAHYLGTIVDTEAIDFFSPSPILMNQ